MSLFLPQIPNNYLSGLFYQGGLLGLQFGVGNPTYNQMPQQQAIPWQSVLKLPIEPSFFDKLRREIDEWIDIGV